MRFPSRICPTAARSAAAAALLLTLALLPATARGQALRWQVPQRGALVYQRTVTELRVLPPLGRASPNWVIRGAESDGHPWRMHAGPRGSAPAGWEQPDFADDDWPTGRAMFSPDANDALRRTDWRSPELCLRTRVELGRSRPRYLLLRIHHDDGVRVWWNGRLVVADDGYGRDRIYVVEGAALDAWQRGDNVFAAQCVNTGGAQYLDVAVAAYDSVPPGVKTGDDLRRQFADEWQAARQTERMLWADYRPPPLLLQGELTPGGDRVRMPPADLRELGWWVAMDLSNGSNGGSIALEAPRLFNLGDLQLKGRAEAVAADGWQGMELQVRTAAEPAAGDDSKRFLNRFVRPFQSLGFDGRLLLRRRLEIRDGRAQVLEFEVTLEGDLQRDKNRRDVAGRLRLREHWRLHAVRENQDAAFRAEVAEAIRRGTAWLRGQLGNPGRPELGPTDREGDSYPSGRLAIALLALLKGGVPAEDEVVARALAELRARNLVDTYSLGNALMVLEARHAPGTEWADLRAGVIERPRPRRLPADDLALATAWTNQLLQNVDTRVDPQSVLRFNYTRGGRYDHSVNQYGLLGLYSAMLCGVTLPATVWEAGANHLVAAQGRGRGRIDLELTDYRTFARLQLDPTQRRTAVRNPVAPAGWHYQDPRDAGEDMPQYGSMTCAGIAGLSVCEAGMLELPAGRRPRVLADVAVCRSAAFGWLAQHLQVRYHPGWIQRQHQWLYYYLYSLERAALLSGIALIQDRDWYFEGAMLLILTQHGDGTWPAEMHHDQAIERCAMAVLFLKQGTLPVLTGR